MDLNTIWFILIGILFTGYAILDGFDLGVGALHLFTKTDQERRLMINSIGPVWDGNEVWLVTGGGALFAAFPDVYATLASGLYLPVFMLLFALIFRAIAIEFRSKEPMAWWHGFWDVSFTVSSVLTSFLLGVVLGNLIWGIPLGPDKEYVGGFWNLVHPYSILCGITIVALFTMHGSIYLVMKTEGAFRDKVRGWIQNTMIFFIICYVITTMTTLVYVEHMPERVRAHPGLFLIPFLNVLAIANIPREISKGRDFLAFLSSCAAMLLLMLLFGLGVFPHMVLSNPHPEYSLTIYNAASSHKTLNIMLVIALIGIPFVLSYTFCIYWIFRGKVKLTEMSY